jgi:hypothetical protein
VGSKIHSFGTQAALVIPILIVVIRIFIRNHGRNKRCAILHKSCLPQKQLFLVCAVCPTSVSDFRLYQEYFSAREEVFKIRSEVD